jgi:multisubunit Na+/H+ antiporter MnhE subunit
MADSPDVSLHIAFKVLSPRRWAWGLIGAATVLWYWLVAAVQVAHVALHPDPPVRPGTLRTTTRLESPLARGLLARLLALAPGTLVIDSGEDGSIELHCLTDGEIGKADARRILERLEDLIERVAG